MFHKPSVSRADHALQVPRFSNFLLFSLHSQTQIYIKDNFCMLLVIKHIRTGDASKTFHLCEVPMAESIAGLLKGFCSKCSSCICFMCP